MGKLGEDEREALRQAAMAARPILERLLAQRADIDARIARFQTIVDTHDEMAGKRTRKAPAETSGDMSDRLRRGQVNGHIDEILAQGGDYREPELRAAIWSRLGIKYSRATLYSALKRGDGKRYEQKEKRWRMKPQ